MKLCCVVHLRDGFAHERTRTAAHVPLWPAEHVRLACSALGRGRCAPRGQSLLRSCLAARSFPPRPPAMGLRPPMGLRPRSCWPPVALVHETKRCRALPTVFSPFGEWPVILSEVEGSATPACS